MFQSKNTWLIIEHVYIVNNSPHSIVVNLFNKTIITLIQKFAFSLFSLREVSRYEAVQSVHRYMDYFLKEAKHMFPENRTNLE